MNIKNEETHRLVRELKRLTGENQTVAIMNAVRERLQRVGPPIMPTCSMTTKACLIILTTSAVIAVLRLAHAARR